MQISGVYGLGHCSQETIEAVTVNAILNHLKPSQSLVFQ